MDVSADVCLVPVLLFASSGSDVLCFLCFLSLLVKGALGPFALLSFSHQGILSGVWSFLCSPFSAQEILCCGKSVETWREHFSGILDF